MILTAPISLDANQTYEQLWDEIRSKGYARVRVDGYTCEIDNVPSLSRRQLHDVAIVIDRIQVKPKSRSRIADSIESGLSLGNGVIRVVVPNDDMPEVHWRVITHSQHLACEDCGRSFEMLSPHSFSFNLSLIHI